jgi:hypothetical protein
MTAIPDSMCLLRCVRCGHEADFELFQRTPVSGELPAGTFQCPGCRRAWRMESEGVGQWFENGLYIPAKRVAVQIPTIL